MRIVSKEQILERNKETTRDFFITALSNLSIECEEPEKEVQEIVLTALDIWFEWKAGGKMPSLFACPHKLQAVICEVIRRACLLNHVDKAVYMRELFSSLIPKIEHIDAQVSRLFASQSNS